MPEIDDAYPILYVELELSASNGIRVDSEGS